MGEEEAVLEQLVLAQAIAHVGSWEWDLTSGAMSWSDELYRIYGLPPRSRPITLDYFVSCLHPEERPRIQRELEEALQQKGRFSYREVIVRPDGELRTLDTIGEVITGGDGLARKLIGTCRDITEEARRELRIQFYREVFGSVQIGLSAWQIDDRRDPPDLRLAAFNPAFERLSSGVAVLELRRSIHDVVPPPAATEVLALAARVVDRTAPPSGGADGRAQVPAVEGAPVQRASPFRLDSTLGSPVLEATVFALPSRHVGLALEDITQQRSAQIMQAGEARALELLVEGSPLPQIFEAIIGAIETTLAGVTASILLVDEAGTHLRHSAAPRLPAAYNAAVDGTPIGPDTGSCGTAAYRREPVFVADMATDPRWADYRELAQLSGLSACWSTPIISSDGRVLGTFALYCGERRDPDPATRALLERAAHVTRIVLERRALDEQLRALAARSEAIREDERTTIARDIHDQLGQTLTALRLDIGWLDRRIVDASIAPKLREMARATEDLIGAVRKISADLRPGILDAIGLQAAIEWQAEEFEKRTGTRCRVDARIGDLQLERALATAVFRIFQESLTNVARHASARQVDVQLALDHGNIRLEVADDGIGLPEINPRGSTLGIVGMGERAIQLGGQCAVRRRDGHGTVVTLTIPLRFPTEHVSDLG